MRFSLGRLIIALALTAMVASTQVAAGEIRLIAHLRGAHEVPPVDTIGSGRFLGVVNAARTQIAYELRINDLDPATITGAQIQVGAPGANGPAIFVLSGTTFTPPFTGTLTDLDLVPQPAGGVNTFEDALGKILGGMAYVNVLTTPYPAGEIRGQIGRIIDIKLRKAINPDANGVIAVGIFSEEDFDARSLDVSGIAFGPGRAHETHGRGHGGDLNGDGLRDLLLHFRTQESGIECGDRSVGLVGFTSLGLRVEGYAAIKTVGCPKEHPKKH